MNTGDIRRELEARITAIQKEIGSLHLEKAEIDAKLKYAEEKLSALRTVYGIEAERLGEIKVPLFAGKGTSYRFAGIKLTKALAILRQEQPKITKEQAHDILVKEGFNFRTNRTRSAVHFAWIALDRRGKLNPKRLAQKVARMGGDK